MNYELLAQCIQSGQLTASEIAQHFSDEVFRKWYEKRYK